MKKIIFLSIFFINFGWSIAQITNNYHNFSVNEGLPSSQVYSMTEDNYGYLWFFTDHGISRYDGYKFENFNKKDGLCEDVIFNYFKTENEIWIIGQDHNITIISGRTPNFTPYEFNDTIKKYGKYNSKDIFIDNDKILHIKFELSIGVLSINKNGKVLHKPKFKDSNNYKVCISVNEKSFSTKNLTLNNTNSSTPYKINHYFTKTKGAYLNKKTVHLLRGTLL